ncbi:hypothetical protein D7V82_14740 [bacterium 1xD8-6]|nr:hypothetical protein D7V72_15890 [bacterium D16-36]RKI66571.1 hypothetical protein D7V82_14740 [bacterium 1xD8-6]
MVQYIGDSAEAEDIVECVDTILSTPYGDMPYMRSMGITSDVLGVNSPESEAEFFNQSVDQVETWEDRANITEIEMESQNELMVPKVVIEDGE